jgi:hypothetical protein
VTALGPQPPPYAASPPPALALPATFGPPLPEAGLTRNLLQAAPVDACEELLHASRYEATMRLPLVFKLGGSKDRS